MAIIKKQPRQWTAAAITRKLASYFDFRKNFIIPNIYIGGGEMDLAIVTPARYLTEIEIKITKADWAADAKKKKWGPEWAARRKYISKFYYAVPVQLLEDIPAFVPGHVGLIALHGWGVEVMRLPVKGKEKIPEKEFLKFLKNSYQRFWSHRRRLDQIENVVLKGE